MPSLPELTYLIIGLNRLVDHGYHDGVTISEVENHIERGDVLAWLGRKFAGEIDLSIYGPASEHEITQGLQDILGGYRGLERRKWGIEHNGLCLLIAWVTELVQRRDWQDGHAA
jgi:hypothetical protein